jgi:hypothetical protein
MGAPLLITWGIRKRLHRKAILLAEALVLYEDSLCKGCGMSGFVTYDRHELTHMFTPAELVCVACEHREQSARAAAADGEEPWPGTKTFVKFDDGS